MFIDEVTIKVIAGKGGDGCTSFRREKFEPMGGPNGGNGGRGANIIFKVDKGLKTLIDLRYKKLIKGSKGTNGQGQNKNGANASDIIIKVPEGTTVIDNDTNLVIADLVKDKEEVIVARGGRGGRGNAAFKTDKDTAPKYSELGEPGEVRILKVELKVLADVGLIGLPSVGKSTILSIVSKAKPKIASYHFTTLSPNLGVVNLKDNTSFVMADLPGLIEGAHEGVGLGFKFLKHAMRTKLLAHVVDMSASFDRDPIKDYEIIRTEIEKYHKRLANKPEIIIANKMDMPNSASNLLRFKEKYKDLKIVEISAVNNTGFEELIETIKTILSKIETEELYKEDELESHVYYKFQTEKPYKITKLEEGLWHLEGRELEKLFKMTRFSEDDAVLRFGRKLKGMGIEKELLRLGAKYGDEVEILDYIFEFKE